MTEVQVPTPAPVRHADKIEMLPIADLVPYARNARTHSDAQVRQIAASIAEFGWTSPILIDPTNGIIAGHGRVLAAEQLKLEAVPCLRLGWLSETQRRAYVLADNRLPMNAGWDEDLVKLELRDLQTADFDLALTGFDREELDAYLTTPAPPSDVDPDDVPSNVETRCKPGDLWQLGAHRLLCGDATKAEDVARLMGSEKADITFTSPPYNAGISAKLSGNAGVVDNLYGDGYDDNQHEDDWLELIIAATANSIRHSRYQFWNVQFLAGNRTALPHYWSSFRDRIVDVAIWDKGHAPPQMAPRVMDSRFEFVFVFTADDKPTRAIRIAPEFRGIQNVFEIPPQRKNEFAHIHAATFPVALPAAFIDAFCPARGSVIDLFSGTGTTMIACTQSGRRNFAMEIDPRYCDCAISRWEKFTGQSAALLESGLPAAAP